MKTKMILAATVLLAILAASDTRAETCIAPGTWRAPGDNATVPPTEVAQILAGKSIVLLGEIHTDADHHRWQLQTLAALHAQNPNMVIGFESFPRRVRPVLDRWVEGQLSDKAFLDAVDWQTVWGFDPALYMPLFHFARLNRIPMVPMNVDRALIRAVREKGRAAVAEAEQHGMTPPAPATAAYRQHLKTIFDKHAMARAHGGSDANPDQNAAAFDNFVDAQITWDRVMADALADALDGRPSTLVVGIVGGGHLEYGDGIPYQLADRGVTNVAVALPWRAERSCADLTRDATPIADVVFAIPDQPQDQKPPPPRLGIMIETTDAGVQVNSVVDGSIAAATGIEAGDVVVRAAGVDIAKTKDLVAVIRRTAPGTWLPITVLRDGETQDLTARFPAAPAP